MLLIVKKCIKLESFFDSLYKLIFKLYFCITKNYNNDKKYKLPK